jgi:hypothetical protein
LETENVSTPHPAQEMAEELRDVARYIRERADRCKVPEISDELNKHALEFDEKAQSALKEAEDTERRFRKILQGKGAGNHTS